MLYWYCLAVKLYTNVLPDPLLEVAGTGFPIKGPPFFASFWTVRVQLHVETNAPLPSLSENFTGSVLPLL